MFSAEYRVAPADAGQRLDVFLAAREPVLSRSRIQDMVKAGRVTLNGRASKASTRLRAGDAIVDLFIFTA
jgi:23S rRNA pseudouridine1911/1915/1917 synthase